MKIKDAPLRVRITAVLYAVLMIWLLFGQRLGYTRMSYGEYFSKNVIVTPFRTVARFIGVLRRGEGGYWALHAFVNLAGNVVMFIPLGIFAAMFDGKGDSFWRCMVRCAAVIAAVELMQLVTMLGTFDIDDLILNTAGAAMGYLLYRLHGYKRKS